jgi:hypothetical protein
MLTMIHALQPILQTPFSIKFLGIMGYLDKLYQIGDLSLLVKFLRNSVANLESNLLNLPPTTLKRMDKLKGLIKFWNNIYEFSVHIVKTIGLDYYPLQNSLIIIPHRNPQNCPRFLLNMEGIRGWHPMYTANSITQVWRNYF